jgi:hypothetical protein
MSVILSTGYDVITLDVVSVLNKNMITVWLSSKIAAETRVRAENGFRALSNRNGANESVNGWTSRKTISMLESLGQCSLIEPGSGV